MTQGEGSTRPFVQRSRARRQVLRSGVLPFQENDLADMSGGVHTYWSLTRVSERGPVPPARPPHAGSMRESAVRLLASSCRYAWGARPADGFAFTPVRRAAGPAAFVGRGRWPAGGARPSAPEAVLRGWPLHRWAVRWRACCRRSALFRGRLPGARVICW